MPDDDQPDTWGKLRAAFRSACSRRIAGDQKGAVRVLSDQVPSLVAAWAKSSNLDPVEKKQRLKSLFEEESERAEELAIIFELFAGKLESLVASRVAKQVLEEVFARAFDGPGVQHATDVAGVTHSLAVVNDPEQVARVVAYLADQAVVIADGHHRYETALKYRDERRQEAGTSDPHAPYESTLVYLANAFAPGTLLLPIHRVIKKGGAPTPELWKRCLPDWQSRDIPVGGAESLRAFLAEHLAPLAGKPAFVADDGSGAARVFWKEEPLGDSLMVRVLEQDVIGEVFGLAPDAIRDGAVSFPKSAERAAEEVRSGEGSVALYINPLAPEDVFRVTAAGEVMPQKSTFYYPKIPTGLVFRIQDEG